MKGRRALLGLLVVLLVCGAAWMWVSGRSDGERRVHGTDSLAVDAEQVQADDAESAEAGRPRVATSRDGDDTDATDNEDDLVELTIVSAMDDEPVAGARVRVFRLPNPLAGTAWDSREGVAAPWPREQGETVLEIAAGAEGNVVFGLASSHATFARIEADGYASVVMGFDSLAVFVRLWPPSERTLHVIDAADEPIAGAVASVHSWIHDPPVTTATTDAAGVLSFSAGDGHEVVIRAPGYATVWIEDLAEWGEADVVMHPGAAIEGVVVTAGGEPVRDAVVRISDDTAFVVRTGVDGAFRFDGLWATAQELEVYAHATHLVDGRTNARPGARGVQVVMAQPATVLGRVFRADGSPAGGIEVRAPTEFGKHTTDGDGRFVITGVRPGSFRIEARLPIDCFPNDEELGTVGDMGSAELTLVPGDVIEDVEIRMEPVPASYLRYVVHGSDGKPFGGFGVTYDDALKRGFGVRGGSRGQRRELRLAVPAGTPVELTFTTANHDDLADHFKATITTRALPEGEPDVIVAPLASADTIELTLTTVRTDGAEIPERADVNWVAARRNPRRRSALPDGAPPTGVVRVPRGESVTVLAWADGCGTREFVVPLTDAPQQRFECRLPPEAIVSGHLVTRTGRPVTRAHVEVWVVEQDGTESLSVASFDQLLPGGAFVADQLAGGRARITVKDTSYRLVAERDFDVPQGGRVELGAVALGDLPLARGTVTVGGHPVAGAGIVLLDGANGMGGTSTGPDGSFERAAPRRPGMSLWIDASGVRNGVAYDLQDVLDASPVTLRADPVGSLNIEIDAERGEIESVEVRLPAGPRVIHECRRWLVPLRVYGLPAGPVELTVTSKPSEGARRVWRGTAEVVAGQSTEVTLPLER